MKILGISPMHDSSVAVIEDGNVVLFLKEERLSRKKRDSYPFLSIQRALELHKPDKVCLASPTGDDPAINMIGRLVTKHGVDHHSVVSYGNRHHLCHASLAFYNSGFDQALAFVIDRNGSSLGNIFKECETVFDCSYPHGFKTLHKNYWADNMGEDHCRDTQHAIDILESAPYSYDVSSMYGIVQVYESATSMIGQSPLENGKTMGLASYGRDTGEYNLFSGTRPRDNSFVKGLFVPNIPYPHVINRDHMFRHISTVPEDNYQWYADYCKAVQLQTQEKVRQFVKHWVDKTGIRKVCITGGYGLNVVSNSYLLCSFEDVDFYFEPLADDSGNSIGAAMHLYRELTGDTKIRKLKHTFFHGTDPILKSCGRKCTVDYIADLLEQQKTVAVFNGRAEAGPRALGNRSILFDASNPKAKEIVNGIKKREWYRPFAAVVLEEDFTAYFNTPVWTSEFMTVSFDVDEDMAESIPGVVHVDGSCRVQTVDSSIPHLYNLLTELKERTECPVLLNTSFNLAGQPLIETQEQALECLANSDLDAVWFPELEEVVFK